MEPAEKRQVRVTLLGQPYTLLARGEPREVELLAQQVDEIMHEISRRMPNADSTRVAVLTCMHLADRLRDMERHVQSLRDRINRKSEELGLLLDQAIESDEK
jgi:cell division protein ZapA